MPQKGWKSVSLPEEMISEIERIIRDHPELGFKTVGSFVTGAVRKMIDEYGPRLEHFNVYEDHVTIIDRSRKAIVNVYFRNKPWCDLCEEHDCEHIRYALGIPKVIEILRKHGWIIEDGRIIKKPF